MIEARVRAAVVTGLTCTIMAQPAAAVMTPKEGGLLAHTDQWEMRQATLEPFYLARSADADGEAFHHLGFTARSRIPQRDLSAWLEVSAVATPQSSYEFEPDAHRLTRIGVRDRLQDVDLTLRYYSIGDAVAANPLARSRLQSLGLPTAGEGAQVSARVSRFGIDLFPEAQWRRQGGEHAETVDAMGVKLRRRFGDLGTLNWRMNAQTRNRHVRGDQITTSTDASTLSLDGSQWRFYWRGLLESEAGRAARTDALTTTHELGGLLQFADDFELAPSYRVTQTDDLDGSMARVAGLRFSGSWPMMPKFSVNLQLSERLDADVEAQIYTASLAAKRRLKLVEDAPESLLVTTSLSYQGRSGMESLPTDGLSVELSFELELRGG